MHFQEFCFVKIMFRSANVVSAYHAYENKFSDCKDHRNKKEVPDPIVEDLISDKIRKRNKSKADLTVENFV